MPDSGAATTRAIESIWPQLLALKRGERVSPPDDAQAAWSLYAPLARPRNSFVLGQLGQSLDGRIATESGHSHFINGPQAIAHLHRLRALADAVVVGVGTVIADDPLLTVRHVAGASPARIVIDPHGRLPQSARVLTEDGVPRLVLQAVPHPLPPGVIGLGVPAQDGHFDPETIVTALAEFGFRRLLIEGGGRTVSAFLAASALDRLHVAVAPLIIGSGPTGICLQTITHLDDAVRPSVTIHRIGADVLFDCNFRHGRATA